MKVMVTGANGFVGKRFMEYNRDRYELKILPLRNVKPGSIDLQRSQVIVHLAGKAHDMKIKDDKIYYEVNYGLTKLIADEAKKQGIPHFIYISSVKVYGDNQGEVFNESSPCHPSDAYGKSKLQAETYLQSIKTPAFKVAIVRPPLVYGPGVKGNMIRFLELANKNYPLPFGRTTNQRSMVFLDNLVELINKIIDTKAAGIFIAGDLKPLSTEELLRLIRVSMNKRERLITIPSFGKNLVKKFRPSLFSRIFGSFVIDNSNTNTALNFIPPYSTLYGIRQMVDWYKNLRMDNGKPER